MKLCGGLWVESGFGMKRVIESDHAYDTWAICTARHSTNKLPVRHVDNRPSSWASNSGEYLDPLQIKRDQRSCDLVHVQILLHEEREDGNVINLSIINAALVSRWARTLTSTVHWRNQSIRGQDKFSSTSLRLFEAHELGVPWSLRDFEFGKQGWSCNKGKLCRGGRVLAVLL